MIFRKLAEHRGASEKRNRQKQRARNLKPQLVHGVSERAGSRTDRAQQGVDRAVSPRLLVQNPQRSPQLS